MRVVQVPLEACAAGCRGSSQRHQAAGWALSTCGLDDGTPRTQQPHEVAVPPQSHVEVPVAVERVEVGEGVVQTPTKSTWGGGLRGEGGKWGIGKGEGGLSNKTRPYKVVTER